MARLKENFKENGVKNLMEQFSFKNINEVPSLKKVILNVGVGEASQNSAFLEDAQKTLTLVAGQKAVITKAKKAISNFKLREAMPIGCKVTLSGDKMWEFIDRLINVTLPRVRDFKGLSNKAFDGRGNYSIGIREQIIFHEIDRDKIKKIHGLTVTVVTSAKKDEHAKGLLKELGMPFRQK